MAADFENRINAINFGGLIFIKLKQTKQTTP